MVPFEAALKVLKSWRTSRSVMSIAFSLPPAWMEMTRGEPWEETRRGSRLFAKRIRL